MSSTNTITLFKEYMEEKNFSKNIIEYNIKVVSLLYKKVLLPQNKELYSIDIYTFEEFTDMVDIIDKDLSGRSGIIKILEAMLILTEFLKNNKMIKGGKIAYYRRIFTNTSYYIEKYDNIKGKKDDIKQFIKKVTKNKLSYQFLRILDEVNVNEFDTIKEIIQILDTENYENSNSNLVKALQNIGFIKFKNNNIHLDKRGRAILRLECEEKYVAILYSLIYEANWNRILGKQDINIYEIISILATCFMRNDCLKLSNCSKYNNILDSLNDNIRFFNLIKHRENEEIFNYVFLNMGIIQYKYINNERVYFATKFGKNILTLLYKENQWFIREKLNEVTSSIKQKNIYEIEEKSVNFIKIFGENSIILDYIGQIYILKKEYKIAYDILIYAYEISSRQGKNAKKILSHIITCCKKLEFIKEEKLYERRYKYI